MHAETREVLRNAQVLVKELYDAHQEWLDLPDQFPTERVLEAMGALYEAFGLEPESTHLPTDPQGERA